MKNLLEEIVKAIVDHPDDVEVTENKDEINGTVLSLKVNQEDMGKVIGREGKIIKAVRTIVRIMAIKNGERLTINLVDQNPLKASQTDQDGQPAPES